MTQPDIRVIEHALHAAGLSRRQAKALLHRGWAGVVDAQTAEADALKLELSALREQLTRGIIPTSPSDA
jgi:hypothetical protein